MTIRARVQVILELDVSDAWGPNCTIRQIKTQAIEAARDDMNRLLAAGSEEKPDAFKQRMAQNTVRRIKNIRCGDVRITEEEEK